VCTGQLFVVDDRIKQHGCTEKSSSKSGSERVKGEKILKIKTKTLGY